MSFPEPKASLLARVEAAMIRVENIVSLPLAGLLLDRPSDRALELVDDIACSPDFWLPMERQDLAESLKRLLVDDDAEVSAGELLALGFDGYWLKVSQPVLQFSRRRMKDPGFHMYDSRWFYADSVDHALQGALAWAEGRQAEAANLPAGRGQWMVEVEP